MIKKNKRKLIVSSLVILLPVVVGLILWNSLPQEMAMHWSLNGLADGRSSRYLTVFVMPLFLLAIHWIGIAVTMRDPGNKDQTRTAMGLVFCICPFLSLFSGAMIYAHAFGMDFGRNTIYAIILGLMFIVIGNFLPKCKRNYTIGIKVKWTLESDANWNATHRFGGKVWVIGGFLFMLCGFLPAAVLHYAMLAAIIVLAVIPVAYSWNYHRRHKDDEAAAADRIPSAYRRITTVLLCVIFAGCAILLFTGNIEMRYGETSFTIDASYYGDLTVDYAGIEHIELREQDAPGSRTSGFGSPRLLMGHFLNEEYGSYIRYTYTMCKTCIVMTVDGKTLVINGKNPEQTQAIYNELTARIASEVGDA